MSGWAEFFKVLMDSGLLTAAFIIGAIALIVALIGKIPGVTPIELSGPRSLGLALFGVFLIVFAIVGYITSAGSGTRSETVATSQPTTAAQQSLPTPLPQNTTPGQLCYGICWEYDEAARTMTWAGPTDGREDVWQPAGKPLDSIRAGYTAIFGPMSVPGEIEACFLVLNGQSVKNGCDGVWYPVPAGKVFRATSTGQIGGFRWQPADGYGWRGP